MGAVSQNQTMTTGECSGRIFFQQSEEQEHPEQPEGAPLKIVRLKRRKKWDKILLRYFFEWRSLLRNVSAFKMLCDCGLNLDDEVSVSESGKYFYPERSANPDLGAFKRMTVRKALSRGYRPHPPSFRKK